MHNRCAARMNTKSLRRLFYHFPSSLISTDAHVHLSTLLPLSLTPEEKKIMESMKQGSCEVDPKWYECCGGSQLSIPSCGINSPAKVHQNNYVK